MALYDHHLIVDYDLLEQIFHPFSSLLVL